MTTFLGVPLLIRGEAWGNVYLTDKAAGEFDDLDVRRGDRARRTGRRSRSSTRTCTAAASTVRRSSSARWRGSRRRPRSRAPSARETDLSRVLELVVKRGRALVRARIVVLLLREGERLVAAAGAGQLDDRTLGSSLPVAGTVAGEVLERGAPERIDDVSARFGVPRRAARRRRRRDRDPRAADLPRPLARRALRVRPHGRRAAVQDRDEQLLLAFAASAATAVATAKTVGGRPAAPQPPLGRARAHAAGRASCTTRRCRASRRSASC